MIAVLAATALQGALPTSADLVDAFVSFCLEPEVVAAPILAKADAAGWSATPPPGLDTLDPATSRARAVGGAVMVLTISGEASAAHPGQGACGVGAKPKLGGLAVAAQRRFVAPIADAAGANIFIVQGETGWRSNTKLPRETFLAASRSGRFRSVLVSEADDHSLIVGLTDRSPIGPPRSSP